METTCSMEEVVEGSERLAKSLDSVPSTGILLIRTAGSSFADAVADTANAGETARAFYVAGKMLADVGIEITEPDGSPTKLGTTLASYGMSLVYAAHTILNP